MCLVAGHGIRRGTRFWRGPDKHDYHVNRQMSGGRVSLRCTQYFLEKCCGRASVAADGSLFRQTQAHNHDPDKHRLQARAFRHAVMERCRTGDHTPFKSMYHQERRKLKISRQAAAREPLVKLRSSMRRARMESRPRIPRTLKDLDKVLRRKKYRCLSRTLDGEDGVYAGRAGSAAEKTLSLIFVTRRMRRFMNSRRIRRIFCDATFSPVPRALKASQVWTISTVRQHHVIPLVRVLMRKRTKAAYVAVLRQIKAWVPRFKPVEMYADYEAGEQAALEEEFDGTLHGCLFHYVRAVGGKARKLRMTRTIKRSPVVRRLVRSFCVLPLLPQRFIMKGYREILKLAMRKRVAHKIIDLATYWLRTWRSKLHVLSVSGCEDRTTNACECDNRMLQDAVRQKRPNVWDFLDGVLEMEDTTQQDLQVMKALRRPSRRRAISAVANDAKILILTQELEAGDISVRDFLKGASYTIVNALNRGLNGKRKTRQYAL